MHMWRIEICSAKAKAISQMDLQIMMRDMLTGFVAPSSPLQHTQCCHSPQGILYNYHAAHVARYHKEAITSNLQLGHKVRTVLIGGHSFSRTLLCLSLHASMSFRDQDIAGHASKHYTTASATASPIFASLIAFFCLKSDDWQVAVHQQGN